MDVFLPSPIITDINDVPDDQGGRVYLDFQRSFHDKDALTNRVEVYTIERNDNDNWVGVLTQSAYNDSTYRVEVTTLIDSSSTSDGLTDFIRSINGVQVSFCITSLESTKVSFRSRGEHTVNDIAQIFGGGGHYFAAGAEIEESEIDEVVEKILSELQRKMNHGN